MHSSVVLRTLIVAACLLGGSFYLTHASRAETVPPREPLASLPMNLDGWTGRRDPDLDAKIVAVLGVDDYIVRQYSRGATLPVGLYVGYHTSQRQGDTMHSPLNCLPGAGWQPLEQGRVTITVPGRGDRGEAPHPIEVNRVIIAKGLDRQLVLYWYHSHKRVVASEYWGKVYTVLDAVRYNRTDGALVRVIAPVVNEDDLGAETRATEFVAALFPYLRRHFPN